MMIIALAVNICFYTLCKILNADFVWLGCFLAPVSCGSFAHKLHIYQSIYYIVLYEIEVLSGICPRISISFLKFLLKFLISAFFIQSTFQISQKWHSTAVSLHFIKNLQKYIYYGIFILFAVGITLRINVEQDNIGRYAGGKLHVCKHHGISYFIIIHKIVDCFLACNLLILQKVRQDF